MKALKTFSLYCFVSGIIAIIAFFILKNDIRENQGTFVEDFFNVIGLSFLYGLVGGAVFMTILYLIQKKSN